MNKKIINPFYLKCVWLTSRSFQRVRLSNTTYIIHIYIYIYPRWTPSTFRFQNLDNFLMLWAHAHNSQQMNLYKNRINTDIIYLFCVRLICPLRLLNNKQKTKLHTFLSILLMYEKFHRKSLLWSLTSALFFIFITTNFDPFHIWQQNWQLTKRKTEYQIKSRTTNNRKHKNPKKKTESPNRCTESSHIPGRQPLQCEKSLEKLNTFNVRCCDSDYCNNDRTLTLENLPKRGI